MCFFHPVPSISPRTSLLLPFRLRHRTAPSSRASLLSSIYLVNSLTPPGPLTLLTLSFRPIFFILFHLSLWSQLSFVSVLVLLLYSFQSSIPRTPVHADASLSSTKYDVPITMMIWNLPRSRSKPASLFSSPCRVSPLLHRSDSRPFTFLPTRLLLHCYRPSLYPLLDP